MTGPAPRWACIVATLGVLRHERYYELARAYAAKLGPLNDAQKEHLAECSRDGTHPNWPKMQACGRIVSAP